MTLLRPSEVDALSIAEQRTEKFTAGRSTHPWGLQSALLWLPPWPNDNHERYAKACLAYADGERLHVVSTASSSAAVVDAAAAGLVSVVLTPCRWSGGAHDAIEPTLIGLGAKLVVVRDRRVERTRVTTDPTAAKLLGLGLTAEQVADALSVPVEQVRAVAAVATPRQPGRPARVVDLDARRRARRAG